MASTDLLSVAFLASVESVDRLSRQGVPLRLIFRELRRLRQRCETIADESAVVQMQRTPAPATPPASYAGKEPEPAPDNVDWFFAEDGSEPSTTLTDSTTGKGELPHAHPSSALSNVAGDAIISGLVHGDVGMQCTTSQHHPSRPSFPSSHFTHHFVCYLCGWCPVQAIAFPAVAEVSRRWTSEADFRERADKQDSGSVSDEEREDEQRHIHWDLSTVVSRDSTPFPVLFRPPLDAVYVDISAMAFHCVRRCIARLALLSPRRRLWKDSL